MLNEAYIRLFCNSKPWIYGHEMIHYRIEF